MHGGTPEETMKLKSSLRSALFHILVFYCAALWKTQLILLKSIADFDHILF